MIGSTRLETGSVFRCVQTARAGAEFDVGVLAVGGLVAVPQACAAVDALFALEVGRTVLALRNGLAGAHGYACLLSARDAKLRIAEDDVIGEAGHGLDFAAHQ